MRRAALGVGIAGIAAGIVLLVLTFDAENPKATQADAVLNALIVWSFVASGVVAWLGRPRNRVGLLMVGAGFSWFFSALQGVPFIAIKRSDKVDDLCWDLQWPYGLSIDALTDRELRNVFGDLVEKGERALDELGEHVATMRERAKTNHVLLDTLVPTV
jgi:hypothetical protein